MTAPLRARAARATLLLVLVTMAAGCGDGTSSLPAGHPVTELPGECAAAALWYEALTDVERRQIEMIGVSVPAICARGRGAIGLVGGPARCWKLIGVVELASEVEARRVADDPPASLFGYEVRSAGTRVFFTPEGTRDGSAPPGPVLGDQSWFRRSVEGLAWQGSGWTVHLDLTRVLVSLRPEGQKGKETPDRFVPGLESFLGIGAGLVGAPGGELHLRMFVRLARTPRGVAKALDAPVTGFALPRLFLPIESTGSYWVQRFRAGDFVESLLSRLEGVPGRPGIGAGGLVGFLRARRGVFFQRPLWKALGDEWALVDPKGRLAKGRPPDESGAFLLATVRDRDGLLEVLNGFARAGALLRLDVKVETTKAARFYAVDLGGKQLQVVVGRTFMAAGGSAAGESLRGMLDREDDARTGAFELPCHASPSAATKALIGAALVQGPISLRDFGGDWLTEFLRLVQKGARFGFQMTRTDRGFLVEACFR